MIQNVKIFGEVFMATREEKEKKDKTGNYEEIKVGFRTKEGVSIFNKKIVNRNTGNTYINKMIAKLDTIVDSFKEDAKKKIFVSWSVKPTENAETKELKNFDLLSISKNDKGKYNFNTSGFLDIVDYKEIDKNVFFLFTYKDKNTGEEKVLEVNKNEVKEWIEVEAVCEVTDENMVIFTNGKAEYPNEIHGFLSPNIMEKVGNAFVQGTAYKFSGIFEKGAVVKSDDNEDVFSFEEEVKSEITYETDKFIINKPMGKSKNIKTTVGDEEFPF